MGSFGEVVFWAERSRKSPQQWKQVDRMKNAIGELFEKDP